MSGVESRSTPMITSQTLESYWPSERLPDPSIQAADLILLAGDRQLSPNEPINFAAYFLDAWICASLTAVTDPHSGLTWLFEYLVEENLLRTRLTPESDGWNRVYSLQLTMKGWGRYADLKKIQNTSRTAFMAMKFGDATLDSIVENHFKAAVKKTGFELRKLTDSQPAGQIDDQIRSSILSARFVVADLSHGNHGAYWEAGFAEGLNLPVIYTCEKSVWENAKTHFDTNHLLTIIWDPSSPSLAADALSATIRATLRSEAIQQS